jgi:hypothetical protein
VYVSVSIEYCIWSVNEKREKNKEGKKERQKEGKTERKKEREKIVKYLHVRYAKGGQYF